MNNSDLTNELEKAKAEFKTEIEEARKMVIALEKAKEIFKKEPDNPTVDDIIDQGVDCLGKYHDYLMPAFNYNLLKLDLVKAPKTKQEKIKQNTEFLNLLINTLRIASLTL